MSAVVRVLLLFFNLVFIAWASKDQSTVERVAFGSCANSLRGGQIWQLMGSFNPDQLILLGDQFYADFESFGHSFKRRKPTKEVLELEYQRLAENQHWRNLTRSVKGWMATLDDHDYGMNNGDKNFRLRNVSQDLFWKFTGASSVEASGRRKSGVYNSKTVKVNIAQQNAVFTYKVILLDVRSNKDTSSTVNGDFLGAEQWQWLTEQLQDPEPDLFLLGSPIQVLPNDKYVEESWKEFPHRRERLLKLVASVNLNPHQDIILLSGDIHSAEVTQATGKVTADAQYDVNKKSGLHNKKEKVSSHVLYHELTSSGLSHSFSSWTVSSDGNEPIEISRSFWRSSGMAVYQWIYPAQYRKEKKGDFYEGVNFGLIDIIAEKRPLSPDPEELTFRLEFRAINHVGETVILKQLPLKSRSPRSEQDVNIASMSYLNAKYVGDAKLVLKAISDLSLEVTPYWGVLPRWKNLCIKAIIAFLLLVLVVLPVLAILWLVFASVYYITRGHSDAEEMKRRARIEEVHQLLSKKNE